MRRLSDLRVVIPLGLLIWLAYIVWYYPVFSLTYGLVGLAHGSIYALIGLGFATVYRIGRFINFSHGDVFMLGAVAAVWLTVRVLHATQGASGVVAVALSVPLAAAVGAVVSVSAERLVYRRVLGSISMVPVVASVGVALVLQNIGIKWNGSGTRGFAPVLTAPDSFGRVADVVPHVAALLAMSLPPLLSAWYLIARTRWGRSLRAASDDPDAARLMGVDVARTTVLAFALAGATAGAAGAVYAQEYHAVSYAIGMKVGLVAYAAAIIGGVGRTAGTILGGLLIGVVESLNNLKPAALGSNWSQTVIFSVMILMLVYKPEGLLGAPEESHAT